MCQRFDTTSRKLGNELSYEEIQEIIELLIEKEIFSRKMYAEHHVLTSERIQKVWLDATKRRKKDLRTLPYFLVEVKDVKPEAKIVVQDVLFQPQNAYNSEQSKEKQSKEKSSSIPLPTTPTAGELTEEEARALLSSTPLGRNKPETAITTGGNIAPTAAGQRPPQVEAAGHEQKPRNPKGLIEALSPYNLSPRELEEVLGLSGHGEIGNPVWQILGEMHGNKRLRMPRLFLLKRLRDAMGAIADSSHEHSGIRNKSAS